MDKAYFKIKVWPHMFYMSYDDVWHWKMNVARVMGNSRDPRFVPDLVKAFFDHDDERVRGMIAWALGRIGGEDAKSALKEVALTPDLEKNLQSEIHDALGTTV